MQLKIELNQMKSIKNTLRSAITHTLLFGGIALSPNLFAADSGDIAYVDSVMEWGAWGLDIEPAAGGVQPPATQAMPARSSHVNLRTNSISALAPPPPPAPVIAQSPAPIPPPVVPATPTPPVVPPVGGPASGLF